MIVFDVVVNGITKETLRPNVCKLKELTLYIEKESSQLIKKYGHDIYLNRRFEYK